MNFDEWWGRQPKGPTRPITPRMAWDAAMLEERDRWRRIVLVAQAVTVGCKDTGDEFIVPSCLMASLSLALDEAPNVELTGSALLRSPG